MGNTGMGDYEGEPYPTMERNDEGDWVRLEDHAIARDSAATLAREQGRKYAADDLATALAALEQSDQLREKYHGIAVAACNERDQAEDKLGRVRNLTTEWRHILDRYGPNVKTADGEYIDAQIVEELEGIISPPPKTGLTVYHVKSFLPPNKADMPTCSK